MKDARTILADRARAIAKPLVDDTATVDENTLPVLGFDSGDERMGIPVASVVALVHVAHITPLPRAVDPVFGVMAWRGRPLAVLTLGTRPSGDAPNRVIVIGTSSRAAIGLLVDELDDIHNVDRASLTASSGRRAPLSLGVTGDAMLVLDADALIRVARTGS